MPFSGDRRLGEIEAKMERFAKLGRVLKLAHRVAEYARTQRHLIRQELRRLSADINLAPA